MRLLLVNPRHTVSLMTFSEAQDITGCAGYMPNLALPTLAALVPDGLETVLVDENVSPIPFDEPRDLVGITGYITQKHRMFEIAGRFRSLGRLVANRRFHPGGLRDALASFTPKDLASSRKSQSGPLILR